MDAQDEIQAEVAEPQPPRLRTVPATLAEIEEEAVREEASEGTAASGPDAGIFANGTVSPESILQSPSEETLARSISEDGKTGDAITGNVSPRTGPPITHIPMAESSETSERQRAKGKAGAAASYPSPRLSVRATFDEPFSTAIAALAQDQGVPPSQWVEETILGVLRNVIGIREPASRS